MKNNIITLYGLLEKQLLGKRIIARSYANSNYHNYIHNKHDDVIGWNDKVDYHEWSGTVCEILINDNSHIDIIFDKTKLTSKSDDYLNDDCFNWHMNEYIEIIG